MPSGMAFEVSLAGLGAGARLTAFGRPFTSELPLTIISDK